MAATFTSHSSTETRTRNERVVPSTAGTPASPATGHRGVARGRARKGALVAADLAAVGLPLLTLGATGTGPQGVPMLVALVVPAIWLAVFQTYGLYPRNPRYVTTSTLNELPQSFHASIVASIVSWAVLVLVGAEDLRTTLAVLLASGIVLVPALRIVARHLLTGGLGPERILMVGSGSITSTVRRSLEAQRDTEVVATEALPAHWRRDPDAVAHVPVDLSQIVRERQVDRVLLSTRDLRDASLAEFQHWARANRTSLTVLPEHFDVVGVGATIDQVQGMPVVSLQHPELSRTSRILKRGMDVVGAGVGLILMVPLAVVLIAAIKLDSRGPVFFRQERIGRGDRPFGVFKFRTMVPDADAMTESLMARSSDPNWLQLEDDPRITRVGRILRATSLDELPQLLNVLRGDMSLVGPRPLSVRDDARVDGWGRGRLDLTPGLTGLWQVIGRKAVPFEDMVKLDYLYVNNWSLWGDVKLLLQTLPAVVGGRGAR